MAHSTGKDEIQVGQWVMLAYAGDSFEAQVIEDLGNIGLKRERMLQVMVPWEEGVEPKEFPVTEDRLSRPS
jgi:hypothetical protein